MKRKLNSSMLIIRTIRLSQKKFEGKIKKGFENITPSVEEEMT